MVTRRAWAVPAFGVADGFSAWFPNAYLLGRIYRCHRISSVATPPLQRLLILWLAGPRALV